MGTIVLPWQSAVLPRWRGQC